MRRCLNLQSMDSCSQLRRFSISCEQNSDRPRTPRRVGSQKLGSLGAHGPRANGLAMFYRRPVGFSLSGLRARGARKSGSDFAALQKLAQIRSRCPTREGSWRTPAIWLSATTGAGVAQKFAPPKNMVVACKSPTPNCIDLPCERLLAIIFTTTKERLAPPAISMHLQSLELFGFKSFAVKTIFNFH